MSVRIDTTEFEFAHGRKPRGRGSWAFCFGSSDEPVWAPGGEGFVAGASCLYGEAAEWARAEAERRGQYRVRVCS